jgi:membrane protein
MSLPANHQNSDKTRSFLGQEMTRLRARLSQAMNVAIQRYYGDMLSLRAMSLTYSTLLALVPFLAVTFSVLKAFGIQTRIEPLLSQALIPLGPDRFEITRRIVEFVNNTQVGVLGAVGIAGLLYTVMSLVSNVEDALNRIWRARHISSWTHRYREYLGVLLVGPVLVFAGLALIASAQSYWLVQRLLEFKAFGNILAIVTQVMPFFFLCAGFAFLYKFVPSTHVRVSSAILGGAVAGIVWHIAGNAFAAFVAGSTRYDAIYSGFAILIVFLFWLYLSWLIVLIGAEIAYLYQYSYVWSDNLLESMQQPIFREWVALSALVETARHFLTGKPPWKETDLSARLGVPFSDLDPILDRFVDRGILLRSEQPEGISLARPPEHIPVTEIFDIMSGRLDTSLDKRNAVLPVLQRRERAVKQSLEEVTLKSLANESAPGVTKLLKTSSG